VYPINGALDENHADFNEDVSSISSIMTNIRLKDVTYKDKNHKRRT